MSSVIPLHKHCIWAHTSTVSSVTPPFTLSNLDHMSTVQGNPTSQAIYLESSTVSMVTSSQAMFLGSHVHSLKVSPPLSPYTWSHMSTVPGFTHLSLHLGLPFSPLVLHMAPSSWALPTDLLPAAKASTAQVLPQLSSRELSPSRALGLQEQGRVRTDNSTHHLTPCSSTHPSHHPYTHSSFHPLISLSIYPFTYPGIQQKHPLC